MNINLNLHTSNQISLRNKSLFQLVHVAEVVQPMWPLLLQVTFWQHRRKSWMVTFCVGSCAKVTYWSSPWWPWSNPSYFFIIAIRCVSRIIHLSFSQSKPWFDTNCPPTCQGVTQLTNRSKPLTGGRYGTLAHRRIAWWGLPDQHTVIWVCFQFLRSLSLWLKNRKLGDHAKIYIRP